MYISVISVVISSLLSPFCLLYFIIFNSDFKSKLLIIYYFKEMFVCLFLIFSLQYFFLHHLSSLYLIPLPLSLNPPPLQSPPCCLSPWVLPPLVFFTTSLGNVLLNVLIFLKISSFFYSSLLLFCMVSSLFPFWSLLFSLVG